MNVIQDIDIEKDIETKRHYFNADLGQYGEGFATFLDKAGVISHDDDDFEESCASAITGGELKQRMYQRIDAWQWKEK